MKKTTCAGLLAALVIATGVNAGAKEIKPNFIFKSYKTYFNWDKLNNCFGSLKDKNCIIPELKPELPETPEKPETNVPEQDTDDKPVQKPENDETQSASAYELKVLELVNIQRANNGLEKLTLDAALSNVARAHSIDMAKNNYFAHENLSGQTPFDRLKAAGIKYSYAGENIAAGQTTPEAVVNAWMNSPGHRANILNANFNKIGIGYYNGGSKTHYWTQVFTS